MKVFKATRISDQKKYFKVYCYLPLILSVCTVVLFLFIGIICAIAISKLNDTIGAILNNTVETSAQNTTQTAFFCWFIITIIGAIVGIIEYIILKIYFSQRILATLYLQRLSEKLCGEDGQDALPELAVTESNLAKLKEMYEIGLITKDEYERKKREIIGL